MCALCNIVGVFSNHALRWDYCEMFENSKTIVTTVCEICKLKTLPKNELSS